MKIRFAGTGAVWMFAYGSLMWEPGFAFAAARKARLWGYHRRFCVDSLVYRGTPAAPGLVLGLDAGGSCVGIAYRIAAADREAAARYLAERELAEDVYRCERVRLAVDGRRVPGYALVVDRAGPFYAGRLGLDAQLARIRAGRGARGSNVDYAIRTARALRTLGIVDRTVDALAARLAQDGRRADASPARRPA